MCRYYLVAIGGEIGSLVRFGITLFMAPMAVWAPLSILIVNTSGCFVISFLNFVSDPSGEHLSGSAQPLIRAGGVLWRLHHFQFFQPDFVQCGPARSSVGSLAEYRSIPHSRLASRPF
jgi:hypothetical protein